MGFLDFFLFRLALPLLIEFIRRRDLDPDFKRSSDRVFQEWEAGETTADRKAAAKRLHDLQHS